MQCLDPLFAKSARAHDKPEEGKPDAVTSVRRGLLFLKEEAAARLTLTDLRGRGCVG